MGMFYTILNSIKTVIFHSMLDIHKQEVHSSIFMVIYLFMKHLLGLILIVLMFITSSNLLPIQIINVFNNILIKNQSKPIIYQFTFGLLIVQIFSAVLFSKIFQSKISGSFCSRYLFFYMQFLEVFKFAILIALGSVIQYSILSDKVEILIVNILNLTILISTIIIFNKFNFTVNYKNKNILAHFQSTNLQITTIFISLFALYFGFIGLNSMSPFQTVIFGGIILTLKVFQIKYGLFKYFYIDSRAFLIYGFLSIIQANLITMSIIQMIYSVPIINQNFIVVLITVTIFSCWAWSRYFQTTQQQIYFHQADDLKSQCQVSLYLKAMCVLTLESEFIDQNSLILSSLKKQHQIVCDNSHCYCKKSDSLNRFIEDYIIHQLDFIRKNFSQNTHILLSELSFRYKTFKKYPNVLTRLNYLKIHVNFSFAQEFAAFCLEDSLKLWILQRNSRNNVIDAETPLQLEDVNEKLQKIILSDIELKNKKWKYLTRGLCRIQEIQNDTMKELQNMKTVQEIYDSQINKFKRSVSFNILLIFYTRKVAFIGQNFQDLNKNIAQSLRKIKDQQIGNEKQFKKFIFNKRSCVIESFIDQNNMGNITKTSKNIYNLFGYHKNKVIGSNINKLMPNFMAQEHVLILDDWVKNGTWRTIGKLKEIFCCHKDQYCFSALIYLKMYVRDQGLFFVTTIFKKNDSDFLILNKKCQIQGMGRKWYKILGQSSKRMPIQILMNDFPSIKDKVKYQYQSIKLTITSLNLGNSISEQYQQKRHNLHIQKERLELIKRFKEKIHEHELQKWQIVFSYKKYRMRNLDFIVFQLTSATLAAESKSMNALTQNFDYQANRLRHTSLVGSGKICEQVASEVGSQQSFQSNQTNHEQQLQNAFQDKGNSSLASIGQRQSFTLSKLLKTFYQLLISPEKINDKRIKVFNVSSIIFTFILIGLTIGSFAIYNLGLLQIQEYIRCNSQINMNMQITTLMYNRFINLNQYKNDPVQFKNIINSSFIDIKQFSERITSNYKNIISTVSELNKTPLYDYLIKPVIWQYNIGNRTEIQVVQFLEYYSYFISKILVSLEQSSQQNLLPSQSDLFFYIDRIKQNFPTLKQLNFGFSQQYIYLTEETSKKLNLTLYLSIFFFFLVALAFSLTTNFYQYFRYDQKQKNLDVYKRLSSACVQKIKDYYSLYFQELIQNNLSANYNATPSIQLSMIQKNFDLLNNNQIQTLGINNFSAYSNSNKQKLNFLGKKVYYQWIYGVILFILLNSVNIYMSMQIKGFIDPLTELMFEINNIMDAENKILESYLDLKGNILLQVSTKLNYGIFNKSTTNFMDSFDYNLYSQLQALMDQNQVTFNKMVTFKSSFISQYDPNFYVDFNSLLTENICQAIKIQIIPSQYQKCLSLVKTNPILDDGVITYMNYFQRKLRTAINDICNNYNQILQTQGENYFINKNFSPIDFSMSFNIKIFNCLVNRILLSYDMGIQQIMYINFLVLILLSVPQMLRIIFWLETVRRQKRKLSFLYAYLLLIPPKIIREVKNLVKDFQKNMQFQQNNN